MATKRDRQRGALKRAAARLQVLEILQRRGARTQEENRASEEIWGKLEKKKQGTNQGYNDKLSSLITHTTEQIAILNHKLGLDKPLYAEEIV